MNRRPSVSVNAAGTVVMSGMYGSWAASRTTGRSAMTNGRSLNGAAARTGTTNPSLIWPVSPARPGAARSARGRGRVVEDVAAVVHGGAGAGGRAAQGADDPLPVDPGHRRPGAAGVDGRAARSAGRDAGPAGRAGHRGGGGADGLHGPAAAGQDRAVAAVVGRGAERRAGARHGGEGVAHVDRDGGGPRGAVVGVGATAGVDGHAVAGAGAGHAGESATAGVHGEGLPRLRPAGVGERVA